MKKNQIIGTKITDKLTPEVIDRFSDTIAETLNLSKVSSRDILRFRLSAESAMLTWQSCLGPETNCTLEIRKKFNHVAIYLSCEGIKCDPREVSDDEFGILQDSTLLQTLGLSIGYSYENGTNQISIMPPNASIVSQLMPILTAIILGIGLALVMKRFFPDYINTVSKQIIGPLFSTLMNLIKTIASPLIFLAVLSGIYGIGDLATLGKVGKKLIVRFIIMTYVSLLIGFAVTLLFVDMSPGSYTAGQGTLSSILNLILQFIPSDIISPFLSGNMLQVIFLGIACGMGMLILGKNVSSLAKIVDQIYSVIQLLMVTIGKLIPFFAFISVFDFILSNQKADMLRYVYPICVIGISFIILVPLYCVAVISFRTGVKPMVLLKKLLPTFIVALTTASSAAAFSINVETCEKKLGISQNITRFGIPLGQVVFKPFAAIEYITVSMIIASSFGIEITRMWVITAILVCGIMSIATPPIPGGSMSIFTILFIQLNIPSEALALAISIDLLVDYIVTAGNVAFLQEEIALCSDKINYLDKEILRK